MVLDGPQNGGEGAEEKLLHLIYRNSTNNAFFGRTKLTKLGFFSEYWNPKQDLLEPVQQLGDFNYVIFKHGPFSKSLFESFDNLKEGRMLKETRRPIGGAKISITKRGQKKAGRIQNRLDNDIFEQIEAVSNTFGDETGGELEDQSLDYLHMTKSEKEDYQNISVEDIIRERV